VLSVSFETVRSSEFDHAATKLVRGSRDDNLLVEDEARTKARLFFDFNRARMNLVGACSMPLPLILRDSSEVPGRQTVAARNRPQQTAS
jgi:hypothetical protein